MSIKLLVTMRSSVVGEHSEVRSCISSDWIYLLNRLQLKFVLIPNGMSNPLDFCLDQRANALLLTGGDTCLSVSDESVLAERDVTELELLDHFTKNRAGPVIGVCRGAQLLNLYFGGSIRRLPNHVSESETISFSHGFTSMVSELPERIEANSFHDYGIVRADLAPNFEPYGLGYDGSIEFFGNRIQQVYGMIWHPEREHGDEIVSENLLKWMLSES